jgi:hypothetical protein
MQLDTMLRRYSKKAGQVLEAAGKRWSDAADQFGSGTYKSKNWIDDIKSTFADVVDLSMSVLPIADSPTVPIAFHDVVAANLPGATPTRLVLIDEPLAAGVVPVVSEVVMVGDPSKSIPVTAAVGKETDQIDVTLSVAKGAPPPDPGGYHGFVHAKGKPIVMVLVLAR